MAATASTAQSRSFSIPDSLAAVDTAWPLSDVRLPRRKAAPRLGEQVGGQLERLLRLHAPGDDAAARIRRVFALLTDDSLDRPANPPFDGLSFINASGLPFQWVFRFDQVGGGWGFLCEAGRIGAPSAERLAQTLRLVDRACLAAGGAAPAFLPKAAALLMPSVGEPWPVHWRSALWVGVGVKGGRIGIKPYFNLNRGDCRDRWLRAGRLLQRLGRHAALQRLCGLSTRCSPDSWPVGLAIDVQRDGSPGRVKLYFRSAATTPAWLARWYDGVGLDAEAAVVRRFLDLLGPTGAEPYPAAAFVISLELHADERLSLKTDLALTKWIASDAAIIERTDALLGSLSCASERLGDAYRSVGVCPLSADHGAATRFVGLGCEPDGARHVNLYVEPPLGARPLPARHRPRLGGDEMRGAVRRGLHALAAARDGACWTDFALPVGASDSWVTAFTLAMLADIPRGLLGPLAREAHGALDWLVTARTPSGGWGYNGGVPDDADSTAWAMIALSAWGRPVPRDAESFLHLCWLGEDGFATYPASTSPMFAWSRAAPDVTAVVTRALRLPADPAAFEAAAPALPPAYWWASPLYTTAMLLDCDGGHLPPAEVREALSRFTPAGAFECALLLRSCLAVDLPSSRIARDLVASQAASGLWPPGAVLRVPNDAVAPWAAIDSGSVFTDQRGVFTTATALAALGRLIACERSGRAVR